MENITHGGMNKNFNDEGNGLMVVDLDDIHVAIKDLGETLQWFAYRKETLIADMVLYAFFHDVNESAWVVDTITRTEVPHKAFPNVRVAFEGAQQAMVLVSQENYALAGARAFVYYLGKDSRWLATAQPKGWGIASEEDGKNWYQEEIKKWAAVWDVICDGKGQLLYQADHLLKEERKKRGYTPDNWLHKDMAAAQTEAYKVIYNGSTKAITEDQTTMNRSLYGGLCRDAHARFRFDAMTVQFDPLKDIVDVYFPERDQVLVAASARGQVITAIEEMNAALKYRNKRIKKLLG